MVQIGLGIYKEGKTVSIACVRRAMRNVSLKSCASFNFNDSESIDDSSLERIAGRIRSFCETDKIKPSFVNIGLPREDFISNIIEMPPVPRQDILQILNYELESHVPSNPESFYFDALPIPSTLNLEQSKVMLISAPRSRVDELLDICRRSNLRLDQVEPAAFSIWRIIRSSESKFEEGLQVYLCFSDLHYEIIIIEDGFPILNRLITDLDPFGRDRKNEEEMDDTDPGLNSTVQPILNALKFSLLSIGKPGTLDDLESVTIVGDADAIILDQLTRSLPSARIQQFVSSDLIPTPRSFAETVAIGLALANEDDQDLAINFIPAAIRPLRRHMGMMMTGVMTGLLISIMVLVGADNYWKTDLNLISTEAKIASLSDRVDRITEIESESEIAIKKFDFFRSMSRDYPTELQILNELTRILPAEDTGELKQVWLESYERKDLELTIRGQSESPEGLITVLEDSPLFEKVAMDGTVTGQKFKIKANLSKFTIVDDLELTEEQTETSETVSETLDDTVPDDKKEASLPNSEGHGESRSQYESETEEDTHNISRGPAFPRNRSESAEEEFETMESGEVIPAEPVVMDDEEKVESGQRNSRDMDEMKENLFDFIQKHKEEGNIVDRDRTTYEEPDPEEAAQNFLEFLKTAAEDRADQSNSGEQ